MAEVLGGLLTHIGSATDTKESTSSHSIRIVALTMRMHMNMYERMHMVVFSRVCLCVQAMTSECLELLTALTRNFIFGVQMHNIWIVKLIKN